MTSAARARQRHHGTVAIPPRVLLVDPFEQVWDVTVDLLQDEGMTVTPVAGGTEALSVAHRERPTVALVEMAIGDHGGLRDVQVASALMDIDPGPVVLFLSVASKGFIHLNYRAIPIVRKGEPVELIEAIRAAHAAYLGANDRAGDDG